MKFIVSSTLLLKNLQSISGVTVSSPTLPILETFYFELSDNKIQITASDLETTVTVSIPVVKAEESGNICIPSKILLNILKTFSDIPITFKVNKQNLAIEISAKEGKYKITGKKGEDFPKIPIMENFAKVNIESNILTTAINKTIFAIGKDELRPVMSGVFFQFAEDGITFVATDAHKLVRYSRKDTKVENSASFIVPGKPLNVLKNILSTLESEVIIEYNTSSVSFTFDNFKLISRLIDGKYPNYEAVIPKENPNKMIVDRESFLQTIRRISFFASQATPQVRFKINGKVLEISAEDNDLTNEGNEKINCSYEGEEMEIGFNSKFLIEMINNIETENITLEMSEAHRAGLLLPTEKENSEEDLLMLVMPVAINQ